MLTVVSNVNKAVSHVTYYLYESYVLGVPVSYPGGPIAEPLKRRGEWPDKNFTIDGDWHFACDQESHQITEAKGLSLTGESAGRQIWYRKKAEKSGESLSDKFVCGEVVFNPSKNPNSADKLFRKQIIDNWKGPVPDLSSKPRNAGEAAMKAFQFYQMMQCEDGHWGGDYGGPMFLLPGLVCTMFIMNVPFSEGIAGGMIQYLKNHQQLDGGWGTHIECASTMFGTVLSYIALRLLGESADLEYMKKALSFIHQQGGGLYAPSWAKFWMAVLGVYSWDGINSIPAEMWSLPRWFPLHPGKLWCHCRMVYLPMCYLYSSRFTPDVQSYPTLMALRKELYPQDYDSIDWDAFRQTCAPMDAYSPLNPVMKIAQDFLAFYERILPRIPFLRQLRAKALAFVIKYIHEEDKQTNYVDIGPVNKSLNLLSVWVDSGCDSNCEVVKKHLARVDDYLWVAEDGVKMQGYNGSQCWDTSFAVRAMVEAGISHKFPDCARKIYSYLDRTQIKDDEEDREKFFRHQSKGGWPFSTAAHGWPISDCTSEGLKGVLALHSRSVPSDLIPVEMRISKRRLCDACDVLLSYQNADGGWATYENNRGFGWYEMLNPSEVFGDIMIDYSYVECSSACITALAAFNQDYPNYRADEIAKSIQSGRKFLKSIQRPDGSWYGSWGNCFCYGTWFGIDGLVAAGEDPKTSPAIKKAVEFFLKQQRPNGGWGESYVACVNKAYPADGTGPGFGTDGSGVVQTAWAVLGLIEGDCEDRAAIDRGVKFLMDKQLPTGDWDQEGITGVFNRSCGITYTQYRNIFPFWALSKYKNKYE